MNKIRKFTSFALLISFVTSFAFADVHENVHCKNSDIPSETTLTLQDVDHGSQDSLNSQASKNQKNSKSAHSDHLNCSHSSCCAFVAVTGAEVIYTVDLSDVQSTESLQVASQSLDSLYRPPAA